jgi:hypothetical protein
MKRLHLLVVVALALFAFGATTALAAHNGNNKAEITGTGDPDAGGQAIVNYSEGTGKFNGRITVRTSSRARHTSSSYAARVVSGSSARARPTVRVCLRATRRSSRCPDSPRRL